jgi:hypothetical protein
MHEDAANFVFDFIVCPIGMLAPQESRFVPAHGPVELMRRIPALRPGSSAERFRSARDWVVRREALLRILTGENGENRDGAGSRTQQTHLFISNFSKKSLSLTQRQA